MTQTALITGCSSGIGAATAQFFQQQGWNVAATMRDVSKGGDLAALPNVRVYALDVTDEASVKQAIESVQKDFGRIDVLVNNAGYGLVGPFELSSQQKIEDQFNTNVFGVFNTIRHVIPVLKAQNSGTIINITSVGGIVSFPFNSLYHATKFAIDGFSVSLQYELEQFNIRVKVVAPGGVLTDFAGRSLVMTGEVNTSDYAEGVGKVMDRFQNQASGYSTAEQIAEVIFGAATDGKNTLRYTAGKDAQLIVEARYQMPLEGFYDMIKQNFGLAPAAQAAE